MLRSSTTTETADMQAIRGVPCRGEDSNLCFKAGRNLHVSRPLPGSNLASPLAIAYGLILASHWGWWVFALYVLVSGLGLGWLRVRGGGRT